MTMHTPNPYVRLDGAEAAKWLGYAKNVGRQMHSKQEFITKILTVSDAMIKITVDKEKIAIYIKANSSTTCTVLSGITNGSYLMADSVNGKPAMNMGLFQPSTLQAVLEKKERSYRKESKLNTLVNPVNQREFATIHTFCQTADIMPAMYTGKMRKVAQLAMGVVQNKAIEYQHSYSCTHGIYTHADGTLWLIEISATNGILAKKLTGYKNADNKIMDTVIKTHLPLIPDGKAFPTDPVKLLKAVKDKSIRYLGDTLDFYTKQSYFSDCGWAFSEDGHTIKNTCWDWPDTHKRGYLYTILIASDATGPIGSVCTLSDSGYIFGLENSHLNFPVGDGDKIYTFDMRCAGSLQNPPATTWKTPIYVFFNVNDPQIFYSENKKVWNATDSAGGITYGGGETWVPFNPIAGGAVNFTSDWGSTQTSESVFDVLCTKQLTTSDIYLNDFSGPGVPTAVNKPIYNKTERICTRETTGYLFSVGFYWGGNPNRIFNGWARINVQNVSYSSSGESVTNVLTISPKNRSCIFATTSEVQNGNSTSTSITQSGGYLLPTASSIIYSFVYDRDSGGNVVGAHWDATAGATASTGGGLGGYLYGSYCPTVGYENNGMNLGTDGFFASTIEYLPTTITIGSGPTASTITIPGFTIGGGFVPPTAAYGTTSSSSPTTSDVQWNVNNDGNLSTITYTDATNKTTALKIFAKSPDSFGNHNYVYSGESAFLKSRFHSENTNLLSGSGLAVIPADGEDMANLGNLVSWVGYE